MDDKQQGMLGLYATKRGVERQVLALVVAVGKTQLMYVQIEYPMTKHVENIDEFFSHVRRQYSYSIEYCAKRFLSTGPVSIGQVDDQVKAILEDLSGYAMLK